MATSLDFARELIAAGDRDLAILSKNISDPEIATEVLGFHSQQAVEKYIKAVLATRGVEFRALFSLPHAVGRASTTHGVPTPRMRVTTISWSSPWPAVRRGSLRVTCATCADWS